MPKVSAPVTSVKESSLDIDVQVALIQALIPLGLAAVEDLLQQEVRQLAGTRYARKTADISCRRWGQQPGSVYLADQQLPLQVPRVRDVAQDQEVALASYQALQQPRALDEGLLLRLLRGLSSRDYEACAEAVPSAFGLSKSTVSRRYVRATAAKLAQFQQRSLQALDLVALFIDGKSFAEEEMIIVLGVTVDGRKIPLDFIQAATENERVSRQLIQRLIDRGLSYEQGLLVVLDGIRGSMPPSPKPWPAMSWSSVASGTNARISFLTCPSLSRLPSVDNSKRPMPSKTRLRPKPRFSGWHRNYSWSTSPPPPVWLKAWKKP